MLSCADNASRSGEDGFTLIELLAAMLVGMVVLGALLYILEGTTRSAQRTFTRVNATQRARTVLANIENELHSACTAGSVRTGSAPIQGVNSAGVQSDANNLAFLSVYGTAASPVPVWYEIGYNAQSQTLIQSAYAVTGTGPPWGQGALTGATTLMTNVKPLANTPVFQYYSYQPEYTDSAGNQYWLIPDGTNAIPDGSGSTPNSPLQTASGLSVDDARNTVEVTISLKLGSDSGTDLNTNLTDAVGAEVTDTVSMRLTTPPNYVPAGSAPVTAGSVPSGYASCQ